jgi:hypothetical protein
MNISKILLSLTLVLISMISYGAGNVIVNKSINIGSKTIGKSAHTGSVVIDGNNVQIYGSKGKSLTSQEARELDEKIKSEMEKTKKEILNNLVNDR